MIRADTFSNTVKRVRRVHTHEIHGPRSDHTYVICDTCGGVVAKAEAMPATNIQLGSNCKLNYICQECYRYLVATRFFGLDAVSKIC